MSSTNIRSLNFPELAQELESRLQTTLPRAKLKDYHLPLCPELKLFLYDPDALEGPLSHDEAQQVVEAPAYWSFCWASGQVLASYILQQPELVKGKRVLDFGCGSGVTALACAYAGAKHVTACDIDSDALLAAKTNAALNNLELHYLDDFGKADPSSIDLIVASDVLYDAENIELLELFRASAKQVLLADSRIKVFPDPNYHKLSTIEATTYPDLNEFEEFNQVRIYLA